jgi:hypothetical protein
VASVATGRRPEPINELYTIVEYAPGAAELVA